MMPTDTVLTPTSTIQLGRLDIRAKEEARNRFGSFLIGDDLEFLVDGEPIDLGGLHCKATIVIAPGEAVKVTYEAIPTP